MKKLFFITIILCAFAFACGCSNKAEAPAPSAAADSAAQAGEPASESQESGESNPLGGLSSMEQFAQSAEVNEIIDEFRQNNSDIDFELSVEEDGTMLLCTARYKVSSLDGDDGVNMWRVMEPLMQKAWEKTGGVPSLTVHEFGLKCYSDDDRLVYHHTTDLGNVE